MAYDDDELERMRARREKSRNGKNTAGRRSSGTHGMENGAGHSRRRYKRKKRVWLIVIEVIVVIALLLGAVGWYLYQRTFGSMQKIEFDEKAVQNVDLSEQQLADMEGYYNILCFGVDSRRENGTLNVGKGTNSDVNMIISANLSTGDIRIVSVFRDTYLNINDRNSYNKINAAYAQGGPEQAVKAINKNLGLNITKYATFNWATVAEAINVLGGVDVDISDAEFSWINGYITETVKNTGIGSVQLTHAGHCHLDGIQAVAYARIRYSDTDYARTERQRIILEKCFEKMKKADWNTVRTLILGIVPELATNVSIEDLIPLGQSISKFNITDTAGFPSARGEKRMDNAGDCVIPQTLSYNVKLLHQFLFDEQDYQVPDKVEEISSHIANETGLTTNAKVIGHVPVDQGISAGSYYRIVGKPGTSSKRSNSLEPVTDDETKAKKTTVSDEGTYATDANGNDVYETDENGDVIFETNKSGKVVLPTKKSGETEYATDENGEVIDPPEDYDETTKASETKKAAETEKAETKKATEAAGPDSDTPTKAAANGPGSETKSEEKKAADNEAAGPGAEATVNNEEAGPGA